MKKMLGRGVRGGNWGHLGLPYTTLPSIGNIVIGENQKKYKNQTKYHNTAVSNGTHHLILSKNRTAFS